ncbi:hypothetical protein IFM89_032155 [Coptis chinensis]|uniref:GDSL esterase/lipase n=1 Tax=Coptis chinensis TaxID=261450 RepID=A0A835MJU4_9MAGN|nr:hypothetical protein IFM89_032155 [Coptis chinensis]
MVGEIDGNDYNYAFPQGKTLDEARTLVPHAIHQIVDVANWLSENESQLGKLNSTYNFNFSKENSCVIVFDINLFFKLRRMCRLEGATVCSNPDQSVSWDGIHLTQKAYMCMTQWLFGNHVFDCTA